MRATIGDPVGTTHLPYGLERPNVLDTVILKYLRPSETCVIETVNEGTSDHNSVLLKMSGVQEQSYPFKFVVEVN